MRVLAGLCAALAFSGVVLSFGQVAPYTETFDGAINGASSCTPGLGGIYPPGWASGGAVGDWSVWSGLTTSGSTGPMGDHTSGIGRYVYCETSTASCRSEFLLHSPTVDVSGLTTPTLVFWRHMFGATTGTLEVQESDGVGGWATIWSASGEHGDVWALAAAALTPVAGMSQVRFRYTGATGFTGDTAIDDVSFRNMPTNVEVAPEFQGNSAESSLDLSGVQGLVLLIGEPGDINFGSSLAGNPFDWALAIAPRIAKSQGAYVTPGSQTLNVPFAFPNFYLVNQFTVGSFLPHPGSLNLPLVFASPVVFSAQQIVVNPAHVDGFTLSQAVQLDVVNGVVTAGPTGDDSSVTVSLSGVGGVPFFGTVYTQGFVSSNGRVLFIGADTDFSPTVAEALTDNPFLGCWTDLNPVLGGTITATLSPSGLTTTYDAVPYFEEAAAPTSMEFGIDIAGVVTLDVSGMVPNPLSGTLTASDAVFLGITAGNTGATNPGRTAFRVGASGASASAFDMLYDFVDFNMGTPAVAGQLDSVTALQTGNGVLTFTPRGTLGYSWTGM